VSYYGHALDEKTPLLRASDAMSREGARLCNLLGMKVRTQQSVCEVSYALLLVVQTLSGATSIGGPSQSCSASSRYVAWLLIEECVEYD
jgi:hypothetical protein